MSNLALRRRGSRGRVTRVDERSVQGLDWCLCQVKKEFIGPLMSGDITGLVKLFLLNTGLKNIREWGWTPPLNSLISNCRSISEVTEERVRS